MNYSKNVNYLFTNQLKEWELPRLNYMLLDNVKTRSIDFGDFQVLVQFNPERIRSSAAKVDAKSIVERPCFLCLKNRPLEQEGLSIDEHMTILVNPFPIFRRHLTIVSDNHVDQRILKNFRSLLALADSLNDYVIFYNGPQCGASAPDHFHFQGGNRGFLPIEKDFEAGRCVNLFTVREGIEIWNWEGYHRGIVTLQGKDNSLISDIFGKFYEALLALQPEKPEPMLNILAYSDGEVVTVHLIPRKVHRPVQFFASGDEQILLSPASVDLGGAVITPRGEDFEKLTRDDLADIFSQVCFDDAEILELLKIFR
jgi:hypothetical protein